jgi:hypothetical protein
MINLEKLYKNLLEKYSPTMLCYRHPTLNLVFYPHQKCASSTYKKLFEYQNWVIIDINDIDWTKDKVFAHIKDPLVRHRKGIVEGICEYFPQVQDLFLTPIGAKFLTNITIIEQHSYTIEIWFGHKNASLVNWIPIDTNLDHVQLTFEFLEKNGAPVADDIKERFLCAPKENVSKVSEIKLYNMLMAENTPGEILRYIDFDRCLYAEVLNFYGFEPENYRDRVEQLKSRGLSELEAQASADQEVASGEYLKWNFNA